MKKQHVVYALIDPRTQMPRYVGRTGQPNKRKARHLSGNTHGEVAEWEQAVLFAELVPIFKILERGLTADESAEREKFWIAKLNEQGCNLLNVTIGGQGWYDGEVPEKVKAKISKTATAQWQDPAYRAAHIQSTSEAVRRPEVREKVRQAALEREPMSAETRQRISDTMTEKWQDPAYAERQREAVAEGARSLWGRKGFREEHAEAMAQPETREKIAEASRQMWQDPETRAKLLKDRRSRGKSSDETKAKIAAGVRRNWEERRRRKQEMEAEMP